MNTRDMSLVLALCLASVGCHHQVEVDLNADGPHATPGTLSQRRTVTVEVRGTTRSVGERHVFFAELPIFFFANHWNYVVNPEQARRQFALFLREELTAVGFDVVERKSLADARLTVTLASTDYYRNWFFAVAYLSVEERTPLLATDCELDTGRALYAISLKSFDVADQELDPPAQIASTWRHNAVLVAEAVARQCQEEDTGRLPREVGAFVPNSERSPNASEWTPLRVGPPVDAGAPATPVAPTVAPVTEPPDGTRPAEPTDDATEEPPPPTSGVTAPAPPPPAPAAAGSCEYCGQRLAQGVTKCPHCGYQR